MWWRLWVRRKAKGPCVDDTLATLAEAIVLINRTVETQRKAVSKLRNDLRSTRELLRKTKEETARWYGFSLSEDQGYKTTCEDVRKLQAALRDMTAVIEELQKKRDFAAQIKASKAQVIKFNDRLDGVDKVLRTMITGG